MGVLKLILLKLAGTAVTAVVSEAVEIARKEINEEIAESDRTDDEKDALSSSVDVVLAKVKDYVSERFGN